MPHLKFRSVEEKHVQELSERMPEALGFALNCPEDYFTLEHVPTTFYFGGKAVKANPMVEIEWFERGQELKDLTAQMVHEALLQLGYEESTIIFKTLDPLAYYENGMHF